MTDTQMDNKQAQALTACQLNICGLSSHSKIGLERFMHKRGINILALQETKVDKLDQNCFADMKTFLNPLNQGVALSVSSSLKPAQIPELSDGLCPIVWVTAEIDKKAILLCSCYCSPETRGTESLDITLKNISQAYNYAKKYGIQSVLIFGDFNARSPRWGDTIENARGRALKDYLIQHQEITLSSPDNLTFVTRQGGSLIDITLSSGPITDKMGQPWTDSYGIHELFTGAPDRGHLPVIYQIACKSIQYSRKPHKVFNFKDGDWDSWKQEVNEIFAAKMQEIHAETLEPQDVAQIFKFFENTLLKACNNHIPMKVSSPHSKPFWNSNLSLLSEQLRLAQQIFNRRSSPVNKLIMDNARESFKKEHTKARNEWVHKELDGLNVIESQVFWKRYKRYFTTRDDSIISNLICPETDQLAETDEDREELLFKTFFCGTHIDNNTFDEEHLSKISDDISKFTEQEDNTMKTQPLNEEENAIMNGEITIGDISWAISKQKTQGKSPDGNSIHPVFLKHLPTNGRHLLAVLCNVILDSSKWIWDESAVVFIKKPGKPSYMSPGAYRPLCLSSYLGKLLERILESRLRRFCEVEEIIDEAQEGFLPQKNTTRYLYKMMATLTEVKRRKLTALVLLIDFEKAFDSVSIPCLIWKLQNYGVKGKLFWLLRSFLTERNVILRVNRFVGLKRACALLGVPQGSILSPILFIIYIADLLKPENIETTTRNFTQCFKFADDGSIVVVANSIADAVSYMQTVADYISGWCYKWRLVINCAKDKTEVIIVKTKLTEEEKASSTKIRITGKELQYVEKSKVLGIIVDEELKFDAHARMILKRVWYAWHKLSDQTTRRNGLNTSSLCILFKSVVLTKLLYGSPIWLTGNEHIFKSFISKALLKMSGAQFYPAKNISHIMLGIPPLNLLNQRIIIKFLLKSLSQGDDVAARILQIESTPGHRYYEQILAVKEFLKEKHSAKLEDLRLSHILLSNFQSKELIYHKDEVLKHLCKKWDNELINNMELICKEDVYRVDGEERKEEMMSFVNTFDAIQSTIFSRMSRRLQNTQIADYLHGHCLRFQDFAFSVEKADKSLFAPICIECGILPDSPYHQLMECTSFDSTYRSNIMEDLASYETNFHIPLLFNKINDMNMLSALRSVGVYGNADLFTDASVIRENFLSSNLF